MALSPQPLNDSGHSVKFKGEGGEEGKPEAMPVPDSHANKHYYGRSGKLKASRPLALGGVGNTVRKDQSIHSVQKSRTKRK